MPEVYQRVLLGSTPVEGSGQEKLGSDAVSPKASVDQQSGGSLSSQGRFPETRTAEGCWAISFPATGDDVLPS